MVDPDGVTRAAASLFPALAEDATLWFAYPKARSPRRVSAALSRDSGWDVLGRAGYEGVRQAALDEDWSALRFRHVRHIPRLARAATRTISAEGRARADN